MGTFTPTLKIDKIMIAQRDWDSIHHYTGLEHSGPGERRRRPTASPDFTVMVDYLEGEGDELPATIVVHNVPLTGGLGFGEPYAIASVEIDGETRYLLLNRDSSTNGQLIPYEGEPEELLQKTYLFDTE